MDLSNNSINDAGGELIAEALEDNEHLEYLNLSHNNLRATSAAIFVSSMKENIHIKSLKLHENCITSNFIKDVNGYLKRNRFKSENNYAQKLDEEKNKTKTDIVFKRRATIIDR